MVPDVSGPDLVCAGTIHTYCTPMDPNALDYTWTVPAGATILSGQGTNCIDVDWGSSTGGVLCVTSSNTCNTSFADCLMVDVTPLVAPFTINGSDIVCEGETLIYSIPADPNATDYDWDIPGTATVLSGGDGSPMVELVWNTGGLQVLCLTVSNSCGDEQNCLDIDSQGLVDDPMITGPDAVCPNAISTYCVTDDPDADSFIWTVPADAVIVSGQDSECINVDWTGSAGGQVCVTTENSCNTSATDCFDVTIIQDIVLAPLSGPIDVCVGDTATYTTIMDPEALNYIWNVPPEASILDGGNGSIFITVVWNTSPSFDLCVAAQNVCGLGGNSCISVTVNNVPVLSSISGLDIVCEDAIVTYCVTPDPSATSYTWTVPFGATIVSGQGTECIEVQFSNTFGGNICVTAENACGTSAFSCMPTTVIQLVSDPIIIGPDEICVGDSGTYTMSDSPESTATTWTIPPNGTVIDGGDGFEFVTILWTSAGTEQVCVTTSNQCSVSTPACMEVTAIDDPGITFVSGPTVVCEAAVETYCIDSLPGLQNIVWTVPPGATIVSGQGTACVVIDWGATFGGLVCAGANTVCGSDINDCLPVTILPVPTPIEITGPTINCVGTQVTYTLEGSDFASDVNWILPACATVIAGQGTEMITIEWTSECIGEDICAVASNSCGAAPPVCLNITAADQPTPQAGSDDTECGFTYSLNATPSILGGFWEVVDGPGLALIDDINNPLSSVLVNTLGTYTFAWIEDNNGCADTAQVAITFEEPLSIDNPATEDCDLTTETYTVTIEITSGEPPFTVTGTATGILNGNIFVSDPIPGNTPYQFEVFNDVCDTILVSGNNDCVCYTDAGSMDPNQLEACLEDTVTALQILPPFLDSNDTIWYALHDNPGPALGNVFEWSQTPTFAIQPGMVPGQVYYISAVVGNAFSGNGLPDPNDPCFSVASGTPVVFFLPPDAFMSGENLVCEGEEAVIYLNLQGDGPFVLEFSDQILNGVIDGDSLVFTPTDITVVELLNITDVHGCSSEINATFPVGLVTPPSALVIPQITVCNTPTPGDITTINFDDLVIGGDTGGTWEDTDGLNLGSFPIIDFSFADTGTFIFTYTTNSAIAPCGEVSYPVEVTIEPCNCPGVFLSNQWSLCNSDGWFDLDNILAPAVSGTWMLESTPPGATNIPTLNGSLIDPMGADPGDYGISFTLTDPPPPGCPTEYNLTLTIEEKLDAGPALTELEYCNNDPEIIQLNDFVNSQPNGSWTDISTVQTLTFDPIGTSVIIEGEYPGNYTFQYVLEGATECANDTSIVTLEIFEVPVAEAEGVVVQFDCMLDSIYLGGNGSSTGPWITYDWQVVSGSIEGPTDILNPLVVEDGVYVLEVSDILTGCSSTDTAFILPYVSPLEVFVSTGNITCFGDTDGWIRVDSVVGGTPPYIFALENEIFTDLVYYDGLGAGLYDLVVEDSEGCRATVDILLAEPQEVWVDLEANLIQGDITINFGDSVELHARPLIPVEQLDTMIWSPFGTTECDTCTYLYLQPLETTTYSVYIEADGCFAEASLTVEVIRDDDFEQPNGFSPNFDGVNDNFTIYGGPEVVNVKVFRIFSRWGEMVFMRENFPPNNPELGWDGFFHGKRMNPGVFVYMAELELIDGSVYVIKGDLTLVR
jgi:gliding motility-associated-like protein